MIGHVKLSMPIQGWKLQFGDDRASFSEWHDTGVPHMAAWGYWIMVLALPHITLFLVVVSVQRILGMLCDVYA